MNYNLKYTNEKNRFENAVKSWLRRGLCLDIKVVSENRTVTQNSYYWALITMIGGELGNTKNQMHEFFKRKYAKVSDEIIDKIQVKGEEIKFIKSTSTLNKNEFNNYIDFIIDFASLQGIQTFDFKYYQENKLEIDRKNKEYEYYNELTD